MSVFMRVVSTRGPWVVKPEKKNYIIIIAQLPLLVQEQTYAELIIWLYELIQISPGAETGGEGQARA